MKNGAIALCLSALLGLTAMGGCSSSTTDDSAGGSAGTTTAATGGAGGSVGTTTSGSETTATTGSSSGGSGGAGGAASDQVTVTMTVDPTTVKAGASVTASVTVTNFVLEAPKGQANKPGHGHFHIYLDKATGGNYLVADQVASVPVTIPKGTSAGAHTLRVSLSGNDHVPLNPAVEDTVDITVQ